MSYRGGSKSKRNKHRVPALPKTLLEGGAKDDERKFKAYAGPKGLSRKQKRWDALCLM